METAYHDFPLNGRAHKLLHGDWYAAKGCSLAILRANDLTINVYSTHVSIYHNIGNNNNNNNIIYVKERIAVAWFSC